jgi:hypothetical protein
VELTAFQINASGTLKEDTGSFNSFNKATTGLEPIG